MAGAPHPTPEGPNLPPQKAQEEEQRKPDWTHPHWQSSCCQDVNMLQPLNQAHSPRNPTSPLQNAPTSKEEIEKGWGRKFTYQK